MKPLLRRSFFAFFFGTCILPAAGILSTATLSAHIPNLVTTPSIVIQPRSSIIAYLTLDEYLEEYLDVPVESEEFQEIPRQLHDSTPNDLLAPPPTQQRVGIGNLKSRIEALELRRDLLAALPVLVPCDGTIRSEFGTRIHPISRRRKMHTGLDIAARRGTPILATGGGTVAFAGWRRGYGRVVEIDHGFGYRTLYAHASKLLVAEGDTVERGTQIALVGSTGYSTGPHLHYEVAVDDSVVDPQNFLIHNRYDTAVLKLLATTDTTTEMN